MTLRSFTCGIELNLEEPIISSLLGLIRSKMPVAETQSIEMGVLDSSRYLEYLKGIAGKFQGAYLIKGLKTTKD